MEKLADHIYCVNHSNSVSHLLQNLKWSPVVNRKSQSFEDTRVFLHQLASNNQLYSLVDAMARECIDRYIQLYPYLSISSGRPYRIYKYLKGGKQLNHVDQSNFFPDARLSFVYYINDNYEGGEIYFPCQSLSYKPKSGDILLFPSNFLYPHEAKPVTYGTKYSIVNWFR